MQNEYSYEDLKELVRKLKDNEEKVSREILLTQYAVPYNRLKLQIKEVAETLMKADVLCGFGVQYSDAGVVLSAIQSVISEEMKIGGLIHQASVALYKHYDVTEFQHIVTTMREKIWAVYEPYWSSHFYLCKRENVAQACSLL